LRPALADPKPIDAQLAATLDGALREFTAVFQTPLGSLRQREDGPAHEGSAVDVRVNAPGCVEQPRELFRVDRLHRRVNFFMIHQSS